jgi:hypothetical protein
MEPYWMLHYPFVYSVQDEELKTGRLDFMGLRDLAGARELMALGYAHAKRNSARIDQHFGDVARLCL